MMKQKVFLFFGKIILLVLLWMIGGALIRSATGLPYAWVTDRMLAGDKMLHRQDKDYNAVFVGSSRVYRGVVPHVFDNFVSKHSNKKIKSFNYGIGGSTSGMIYGQARELIADKSLDLDYIFIELRSLETSLREAAFVKNLHTHRSRIWVNDFQALRFGIRSMWGIKGADWDTLKKIRYTGYFLLKYIECKLNVGGMIRMWEASNKEVKVKKELCQEGWCPMDYAKDVDIKKLRKKFVKSASHTLKSNRENSKIFASGLQAESFPSYNKPYAEELIELIIEAAERDITLMVVALPMMKGHDYENIYPVFAALPTKHKIDIADSGANPELYMFDHCWDDTHANEAGARLLTQRLAQRFLKVQLGKEVKIPYWQKKEKQAKIKQHQEKDKKSKDQNEVESDQSGIPADTEAVQQD